MDMLGSYVENTFAILFLGERSYRRVQNQIEPRICGQTDQAAEEAVFHGD
jgi:hypothetical protein